MKGVGGVRQNVNRSRQAGESSCNIALLANFKNWLCIPTNRVFQSHTYMPDSTINSL